MFALRNENSLRFSFLLCGGLTKNFNVLTKTCHGQLINHMGSFFFYFFYKM